MFSHYPLTTIHITIFLLLYYCSCARKFKFSIRNPSFLNNVFSVSIDFFIFKFSIFSGKGSKQVYKYCTISTSMYIYDKMHCKTQKRLCPYLMIFRMFFVASYYKIKCSLLCITLIAQLNNAYFMLQIILLRIRKIFQGFIFPLCWVTDIKKKPSFKVFSSHVHLAYFVISVVQHKVQKIENVPRKNFNVIV